MYVIGELNIEINNSLNLMVTFLFEALTPRAMEYVKFWQQCFDSDSCYLIKIQPGACLQVNMTEVL